MVILRNGVIDITAAGKKVSAVRSKRICIGTLPPAPPPFEGNKMSVTDDGPADATPLNAAFAAMMRISFMCLFRVHQRPVTACIQQGGCRRRASARPLGSNE